MNQYPETPSIRFTRRELLRQGALAGLAVGGLPALLAACSSGSTSTSSPSAGSVPTGPITLTMWYWGAQEAEGLDKYVEEAIARYHTAHPNVTIDAVLQSTDNLMPNFAAATKAKKGPDIEYRWGGIWALANAWDGGLAPVSDYIPQSELSHYLNRAEDTYGGKVWTAGWYVQPSFPVLYRSDVLAKAGISQPPATWDELLSDCRSLRAVGITPMAGGVKDGWFGGWLFDVLASQSLTSIDDLLLGVTGEKNFTDPVLAEWWTRLGEMIQAKAWNDDIGSQDLYQAQQTFVDGKSAMTITAGTDVRKFVDQVGADKVGVMAMPAFGTGIGAGKLGSTSQTLGITSWSPYKQQAADFIMFLHTPDELALLHKATGTLPADDRFDLGMVDLPQLKQLFQFAQDGGPALENFIPTDLDANANFAGVQLMFAGKITAEQAAATTESDMQRIRTLQPDLIDHFKQWVG